MEPGESCGRSELEQLADAIGLPEGARRDLRRRAAEQEIAVRQAHQKLIRAEQPIPFSRVEPAASLVAQCVEKTFDAGIDALLKEGLQSPEFDANIDYGIQVAEALAASWWLLAISDLLIEGEDGSQYRNDVPLDNAQIEVRAHEILGQMSDYIEEPIAPDELDLNGVRATAAEELARSRPWHPVTQVSIALSLSANHNPGVCTCF